MKVNVKNEVVGAINEVMGTEYDKDNLADKTSLTDDLMFDSITTIQLIIELEDRFNISIDELDDFSSFETVGTICDYVKKQVA